jgi:hypothetical protein
MASRKARVTAAAVSLRLLLRTGCPSGLWHSAWAG